MDEFYIVSSPPVPPLLEEISSSGYAHERTPLINFISANIFFLFLQCKERKKERKTLKNYSTNQPPHPSMTVSSIKIDTQVSN